MISHIHVAGRWRTRTESPDAISKRLAGWLSWLEQIDAQLAGWSRLGMRHRSVVPRMVTMPPDQGELRDWIAENPVVEAQDGRKVMIGYSIRAGTPEDSADYRFFSLQSDNEKSSAWFRNEIGITWPLPRDNPQKFIGVVRAVVLATATAWNCEWAGAMPGDFAPEARQGKFSKFRSGWVVYLDRTHSSRLAVPEGIAFERLPDGAVLLTTVANEIFDRHKAEHLSAAKRVQAALNQLSGTDLPL